MTCPVRIVVSTPDFLSGNGGSIPPRDTMENNFKTGDQVKVLRKPTEEELKNWDNDWPEGMDRSIGNTYEVVDYETPTQISLKGISSDGGLSRLSTISAIRTSKS